jgi:hypothetical protein
MPTCHNFSLGLTIEARACKGAGYEWNPRVTFHVPRSARECEGMSPHTPKWTPTLGVKVLMDSWIFIGKLQGSKFSKLRSSLYNWKALEMQMSKMGSYDPFGHLKHKLWPKEGPGIKLAIWLLTTKSWKSPRFTYLKVVRHIHWKALDEGYNFALDLTSIKGLHTKLWAPKVVGVPTLRISWLPFGSPGTKWHLGASLVARHKVYYKGEDGGFLQVRAVVSLVSLSLPMARPCTKGGLATH